MKRPPAYSPHTAPRVSEINILYKYIRIKVPDADYDTKQHLMSIARHHYLNNPDPIRRVKYALEAIDFYLSETQETPHANPRPPVRP